MPDGIPPHVLRLYPLPGREIGEELVYEDLDPSGARENGLRRPRVLINMVASLDGRASVGGKAGSIGGGIDRRLMRLLRSKVDGVMVGAGTLRSERMSLGVPEALAERRLSRGLDEQPLALVLTRSGNVALDTNLIEASNQDTLVLMPEGAGSALREPARAVKVPVENDGGVDLALALEHLKEYHGIELLLVEGGPSLNHALIRSGLADELFLTLAPKLVGGARSLTILQGPELALEKPPDPVSVYLSEGHLFLRYALHPPGRVGL